MSRRLKCLRMFADAQTGQHTQNQVQRACAGVNGALTTFPRNGSKRVGPAFSFFQSPRDV